MRKIKVRWNNQRSIERIYRWLKLEPDMCGCFRRKGGDGRIIGYKTEGNQYLVFNFCKRRQKGK